MNQDWKVRLNKNVRKTLKDLGKGVNRRLKTALKKLEENPKLGKGLSGYKGFYSYRTGTPGGEYRIIYRLKREDNLVLVDLIGPREEVYEILERKRD